MPFNLESKEERIKLIHQIKGFENQDRKEESFKQNEVFQDRATEYVYDYLRGQFSNETVNEMPVISTINLARRIVQQQASLYKSKPERVFSDLTDEQDLVVKDIYERMYANAKLNKSNEYFKLQSHNILQVLPKKGSLQLRVLRPDQIDVVPDPNNPEEALIYIISAFDRTEEILTDQGKNLSNPTGGSRTNRGAKADRVNQDIADKDDWESPKQFFTVWSADFNFVMNEKGDIVSDPEDIANPIAPMLPFVDIAEDRDFEYWVRVAQSITDFTIQYNAALSDIGMVVRMQGFAQAVISGPQDLLPETMKIGHNTVISLPIDPNNPVESKFEFVSPSPDLAGSISYLEFLLANFLSSRGVDPKTVSGKTDATNYTSGVERLLALIEKFEATKVDIDTFQQVERELYMLVKVWHNTLKGAGILLPILETADLPLDSEVTVSHEKPEMIQTSSEIRADIEFDLEQGLMSRKEALMKLRGIDDEEEATELLEKIEGEDFGNIEKELGKGQRGPEVESEDVVSNKRTE